MTTADLIGNLMMAGVFAGIYTEACCRLRAIKGAGWCGDSDDAAAKVD